MKRLFLLLCIFAVSAISAYSDDNQQIINGHEIRKDYYKKGYSEIYTINENGISASRVINFPGKSYDELLPLVKKYIRKRIENSHTTIEAPNYGTDTDNTLFEEERITIKETSPGLKFGWSKVFVKFTYRIDVKKEKVRLNIIIRKYIFPTADISPFEHFPFKKYNEKVFRRFTDYILNIFDNFSSEINSLESESDW